MVVVLQPDALVLAAIAPAAQSAGVHGVAGAFLQDYTVWRGAKLRLVEKQQVMLGKYDKVSAVGLRTV